MKFLLVLTQSDTQNTPKMLKDICFFEIKRNIDEQCYLQNILEI